MEKTTHIKLTIPSEELPVVLPVGGVDVLSILVIPCIDEASTLNSPKLLFAAAVRSVSSTEASDTIDVNSKASSTIKLPQLQVQRQSEEKLCILVFHML